MYPGGYTHKPCLLFQYGVKMVEIELSVNWKYMSLRWSTIILRQNSRARDNRYCAARHRAFTTTRRARFSSSSSLALFVQTLDWHERASGKSWRFHGHNNIVGACDKDARAVFRISDRRVSTSGIRKFKFCDSSEITRASVQIIFQRAKIITGEREIGEILHSRENSV